VPIAINGFGRIGRQVARIAMKDPEVELKLINASYDPEYLAYMMKYDSIHGRYDGTIEASEGALIIDGVKVALSATRDPAEIPFAEHGADYVCESTGVFLTTEKVAGHLKAGAKKVVFSAPAKDDSHTIVMGVNQETYDPSMSCVSCASCTTNGLAPAVKAVHDAFGIKRGLMTTIHAMTASQPTVDSTSKKDWRGGRAASGNIIPSSTGAAKAVAKVVPAMKGKLTGMAFRVPTIDVSVVDLTCELEKATTYEEICAEIKKRSEGDMKGFLGYCDEPLVSTDFETNPISCTFDSKAGIMLDPTFVKLVMWYDNEWGYSCRVVDLIKHMAAVDAKAS
jgi:glyceraldehyde 3-phosphate dehydrogenase